MAARLREARELAGYDGAADAARALRINYSTYAAHENGVRGFARSVARYAAFYKVDMKWLSTGIGKPRGAPIEARILALDPEQQNQVMQAIELFETLKAHRRG